MMTPDVVALLATVGAAGVVLAGAHDVADYWLQTPGQSARKGAPGWPGRLACAAHVTTYVLTALVGLLGLAAVTGWRPAPGALLVGLAVHAVAHYVVDRRAPLRRLAVWIGKDAAWLDGGGGLALLDQAWHRGWIVLVALVVAA